jgi:hypothetical protein
MDFVTKIFYITSSTLKVVRLSQNIGFSNHGALEFRKKCINSVGYKNIEQVRYADTARKNRGIEYRYSLAFFRVSNTGIEYRSDFSRYWIPVLSIALIFPILNTGIEYRSNFSRYWIPVLRISRYCCTEYRY